jgi:hypothetical protein
MRGLDLHVRVQRRPALHLHNDRSGRHVLFVLPGDGLKDTRLTRGVREGLHWK